MVDYYKVLEVLPSDSLETIRKSYKNLVKKYHPDVSSFSRRYAEEKIREINEAYAVLSDPAKRKEYDAKMFPEMPSSGFSSGDVRDKDVVVRRFCGFCEEFYESVNKRIVMKSGHERKNREACDRLSKEFSLLILADYDYIKEHGLLEGHVADSLIRALWAFATGYSWSNDFIASEKFMGQISMVIRPSHPLYQQFLLDSRTISVKADVQKRDAEAFGGGGASGKGILDGLYEDRVISFGKDWKFFRILRPFLRFFARNNFLVVVLLLLYVPFQVFNLFSTAVTPQDAKKAMDAGRKIGDTVKGNLGGSRLVPQAQARSGYVPNEPILNADGYCYLMVDNTKNLQPVYARLWSVTDNRPVRSFYVAGGDSFTMRDLKADTYELRCRKVYDTGAGGVGTKSPSFELGTGEGKRQALVIHLHPDDVGGNVRTERIDGDRI